MLKPGDTVKIKGQIIHLTVMSSPRYAEVEVCWFANAIFYRAVVPEEILERIEDRAPPPPRPYYSDEYRDELDEIFYNDLHT